MSELAIILPIYKSKFLRETLDSLAAQTCQSFMAYICDDCSPYNLEAIVKEYEGKFPFVYFRFDQNLGGTDLVCHWERCIAMTKGEKWLWLFSDDDIMDPDCVASFYEQITKQPDASLFHFDTRVIEADGQLTKDAHYIKEDYPAELSAKDYLQGRLSYRYNSFIVDFIFSSDLFIASGGFVHYDLAWCSDDATWYRMSKESGIITIPSAKVYWRKSNSNITPDHSEITMLRKIQATKQHLHFCKQEQTCSFSMRLNYFIHTLFNARCLGPISLCKELFNYLLR